MANITLARETVRYAADCLRHGERALAFDLLREDGNGLQPEQKKALATIIRIWGSNPLTREPLTQKEQRDLENRMMGVVQPATWTFLHDEKLVAEVLSNLDRYNNRYAKRNDELRNAALGIVQVPHSRMHQLLIRNSLQNVQVMNNSALKVHYQRILRSLEVPERPLNFTETFACFPELTTLQVRSDKLDLIGNWKEVADAIAVSCPKFHCLDVSVWADDDLKDFSSAFKNIAKKIVWYRIGQIISPDQVKWFKDMQKYPHLKELELVMKLPASVYENPQVLEGFTGLDSLKLCLYRSDVIEAGILTAVATLPLKTLNFDDDGKTLGAASLRLLHEMSALENLDIRSWKVSYEGIKAFLKKCITIQKITLPAARKGDLEKLRKEFPGVEICVPQV